MSSVVQTNFRIRKAFARLDRHVEIPNLIDIQKRSYEQFLQADPKAKREDIGLQAVFKSVFPIKDYNENCSLEFVEYRLEKPKYDVDECIARGMNYAAPVKVSIRLVVWDLNQDTGVRSIRDVKEQEVYFGEIPLMTNNGTFIINGTERVIVSQLHRSPGAFFDHDRGKQHSSGKLLYSARIIPYRGSWIDFEFDAKDILHVRIDRRRKLPATVLLRALYKSPPNPDRKDPEADRAGLSAEEILGLFYRTEQIYFDGRAEKVIDIDLHTDTMASVDIENPEEPGTFLVRSKKKITKAKLRQMKKLGLERMSIGDDELYAKYSAEDVYDEETGEIILECNEQLTASKLAILRARGCTQIRVLFIDGIKVGSFLRDTLAIDKVSSPEEARIEIFQRLRPGDPATPETSETLFENLFYKSERYDLSRVGRLKLNHKFNLDRTEECVGLVTSVFTGGVAEFAGKRIGNIDEGIVIVGGNGNCEGVRGHRASTDIDGAMIVHLAGELATDLDGADAALEDSGEHAFNGMFETTFETFETHRGQVRAADLTPDAGRFSGQTSKFRLCVGFVSTDRGQ